MKQNAFYLELLDLLKKDIRKRFYADNERDLLRNKVYECAMKMDKDLIKLLLSNDRMKEKFFTNIDGTLVFDKSAFGWAINNKAFLQDSYTKFKNTIGLIDSKEQFISSKNDVVLSFPYKDCVLEGGQTKEDQKREEIYYNELLAPDDIDRLLAPKVFTNMKRYTKDGEESLTEFKDTDNLLIKGNNLLALSSLLKRYEGRVKCIYIDPPYNTGNDSFRYNDNFNHSTWLVFMKNRLEIAKKLLKDNGVIIVHCDYIEEAYLKVLLDEIFDRENFVNSISVRDSHPSGLKLSAKEKNIIKTKSTMLVYKKNKLHIQPIYQRRKDWDTHFNTYLNTETLEKIPLSQYIIDNKIVSNDFKLDKNSLDNSAFKEFVFNNRNNIFQSTKEIPQEAKAESLKHKDTVIRYGNNEFAYNGRRLSSLEKSICNIGFDGYYCEDFGKLLCDFWDDVDFNNSQNEGNVSFPAGKKPELLLARLLTMFTSKGDLVLDYHLGSGSTSAVAHKMGRQYIGIEQLNYEDNDSVKRLNNVIRGDTSGISEAVNWQGGGSFVYCELKELNHKYINEIQVADDSKLNELYQEIINSEFISYKADINKLKESEQNFKELSNEDKRNFLIQVLDKNLLYVNYCDMEDEDLAVTEEEKAFTRSFYGEGA